MIKDFIEMRDVVALIARPRRFSKTLNMTMLREILTNFVKESVKSPLSGNGVCSAASWLLYFGIIGHCDLYNNGDVMDVVSNRRAYFTDTGIANYISGMVTIQQDAIKGMLKENIEACKNV